MGLTWIITLSSNWKEYINEILVYLRDTEGYGDFRTNLPNLKKARTRDDYLDFLVTIKILNLKFSESTKNQNFFQITDLGLNYILSDDDKYKSQLLHNLLYKNILHYRFAYDYILSNDLYEFELIELHEKLVVYSSMVYGARIYDKISFDNVLNCFLSLEVITQKEERKKYYVTEEYKITFNEEVFEKMVLDYIKNEKYTYSKELCDFLIKQQHEFSTKEYCTNDFIISKLEKMDKKGKIEFIAGTPKPGLIPAKYTLIKVR